MDRITDFGQFQRLRAEWNSLLSSSEDNSIFLTYEWLISWWKTFSEGKSLAILLIKNEKGECIGIAPLMSEGNIFRFIASQEVTDYCDFIILQGRAEEFYQKFLGYLKIHHLGIERIELMNIKSTSAALTLLPRLAPKHGFSCSFSEIEVTPILKLPHSYQDFLSLLSRKNRHELRRKLRRMEELDDAKIVTVSDSKELHAAIENFIELHRKSDPLKQEFWGKKGMADFFHEIISQFSPRKWVELNYLLDKEKIVASLLNFLYEDRIYFYNIAFDKDYSRFSPGLFLFNHCIKQAILEKKKEADFLRGREKYKYYFGAKDSKIFCLTLIPE